MNQSLAFFEMMHDTCTSYEPRAKKSMGITTQNKNEHTEKRRRKMQTCASTSVFLTTTRDPPCMVFFCIPPTDVRSCYRCHFGLGNKHISYMDTFMESISQENGRPNSLTPRVISENVWAHEYSRRVQIGFVHFTLCGMHFLANGASIDPNVQRMQNQELL